MEGKKLDYDWVVLSLDCEREKETKAEGKRLKMANVDFRISQRSSAKNLFGSSNPLASDRYGQHLNE
jgi:hypothetical protein